MWKKHMWKQFAAPLEETGNLQLCSFYSEQRKMSPIKAPGLISTRLYSLQKPMPGSFTPRRFTPILLVGVPDCWFLSFLVLILLNRWAARGLPKTNLKGRPSIL